MLLPFMMRDDSVTIHDAPKRHCEDPTVDDYSVLFEFSDLRIPFQLKGVFSCSHSLMLECLLKENYMSVRRFF